MLLFEPQPENKVMDEPAPENVSEKPEQSYLETALNSKDPWLERNSLNIIILIKLFRIC